MESVYDSTTTEVPTDFYLTSLVPDFNNPLRKGEMQQGQKFHCPTYNLVILSIFGFISLTFGLFGNGLSIIILWKDQKKSATLFLLLCLALTDSLVLVSNCLVATLPILIFIRHYQTASLMTTICYVYMDGITTIFLMMTIWTTVLVTWHRYVNVCIPFKAKQWGTLRIARIQFAVIIILSILFNIPKFFERDLVHDKQRGPGFFTYIETPLMKNTVYFLIYNTVLYYIFFYILPVLMLLFMTVLLIKSMRDFYKNRKQLTSSASEDNKREITMSLVIVVVVFLICHMIGPSVSLLQVFAPDRSCGSHFSKFGPLKPLFTEISSAINFVIYMLCVKRFRAKIRLLFHNANQVSTTGEVQTKTEG